VALRALFYRALLQKRPMIENEHKGQKAMQLAREMNLLTRGNIVSFTGLFCKRDL